METKKTITITIIVAVDVIGTLTDDSLKGNIYLFDNNKPNGSSGEGTEDLKTKLTFNEGEEIILVWNIMPLEPESFAGITQVVADKEYIKIEKKSYEGSDVIYWKGILKKRFEQLTYQLGIKVGTRDFEYPYNITLIGDEPTIS